MAIDFEVLRTLAQKAEREAPVEIVPALPVVNTDTKDGLSISISIPENEGTEFIHWRLLHDLGFIRVRHDGRPGFGNVKNKVEGLTAKGEEFIELSRDSLTWTKVIGRCTAAKASTMEIVLRELRKEARSRMNSKKAI
jgi:hypothetical protein